MTQPRLRSQTPPVLSVSDGVRTTSCAPCSELDGRLVTRADARMELTRATRLGSHCVERYTCRHCGSNWAVVVPTDSPTNLPTVQRWARDLRPNEV